MTKVVEFWKRMSFWTQARAVLGSLGIGSEFATYFADGGKLVHTFIGCVTVLLVLTTFMMTDKDKDDIVDWFQKTTRRKH